MLSLSNKLSLTTQPIYKFVNKYSVDFDGVDDYIQVGDVGRAKSMSFWFKPDAAIDSSSSSQRLFGFSTLYYGIQTGSATGSLTGETLTVLPDGASRTATTRNFDAGEWYHVVISWNESASYYDIYVNGVLETDLNTGTHTLADWSNFRIGAAHDGATEFDGKLDEVAVYDRTLTQAEITRMYNTYYSPNRIANGNFAQEGVEEVTNGDFSQIGSELVATGNFSSFSVQSGDVTITDGTASFVDGGTNPNSRVLSSSILTANKTYKVVFSVTRYVAGNLQMIFGGASAVNVDISAGVGTYTVYITAGSSTYAQIKRWGSYPNFDFDLTSISIKEVAQDWTLSNVDFSLGQVDFDNDTDYIFQNFSQTISESFKVDVEGTGTVRIRTGFAGADATRHDLTLPASYYFTVSSDTNRIQIYGSDPDSNATVTNISVKEVGQHWTVTGSDSTHFVEFLSTGARFVSDTTSPVLELKQNALTSGKEYKLTCNVAYTGAGQLRVNVGTNLTAFTEGANTRNFTATSNTMSFLRENANVDAILSSVVVQELKHDATNLMLNAGDYQSANPLITSTKSMEFDGTDDHLKVTNAYGSFTGSISAWVKRDSNSSFQFITDFRDNSGTGFFYFDENSDTLVASSGTIYVDGVAASTLSTDGNWHLAVVTGITLDITQSIFIGQRHTGIFLLNGKMTEVGLWNRTLTALEVASLYNQGVPTDLLVSRGDYLATGLQGYWKMGDGTNDEYPVIYDQVNPTLGSELITNGDFSTSGTVTETSYSLGWSVSADSLGHVSISDGNLTILNPTGGGGKAYATNGSSSTTVVESGKTYKLTYDVTENTNNSSLQYHTGSVYVAANNTVGSHTIYYIAGGAIFLFRNNTTNSTIKLDNVSLKQVQGNPATMTNMLEGNITNQYPLTKIRNYYRMGDGILDGYPIIQDQTSPNLAHIPTTNLATYSEDLSNWYARDNAVVAVNQTTSPTGTLTADKITFDGTQYGRVEQIIAVTNGNTYTFSVYLKNNDLSDVTQVRLGFSAVAQGQFFTITNEWKRYSITVAANGSNEYPRIQFEGTGSLFAWGGQFEEQNQATAYIKSDGIAAVRKSSTTNLISYSEDFSQYSLSNGNITSTNNISPIATNDATLITPTSSDCFLREMSNSLTSGTVYTVSVYLKSNTGSNFDNRIRLRTPTSSQDVSKDITVTTEWQRFSLTISATQTDNYQLWIGGGATWATGENLLLWGVQLEEQTQAETYAKTTGLPVTIDLFTENNYGTMTNMSASDIVEDTP